MRRVSGSKRPRFPDLIPKAFHAVVLRPMVGPLRPVRANQCPKERSVAVQVWWCRLSMQASTSTAGTGRGGREHASTEGFGLYFSRLVPAGDCPAAWVMQIHSSVVTPPRVPLSDRLRALLELMRPANLFTAGADSVAGAAVAGTAPIPALVLSSIALYAGGVVFNDVLDRGLDATERPERPLPSGRASVRSSVGLACLLWAGGIGAAWILSPLSGILAMLIAGCAFFYDARAKHSASFGPLLMGSCRGLNLLLGASAVPSIVPECWFVGLIPLAFVAGITIISAGEVHGGSRPRLNSGVSAIAGAIAGLVVFLVPRGLGAVWAVPVLILLVWRLAPPLWQAAVTREPHRIRRAVVTGVLSLIILDAVITAGCGRPLTALVLLALSLVSGWVARRFAVS